MKSYMAKMIRVNSLCLICFSICMCGNSLKVANNYNEPDTANRKVDDLQEAESNLDDIIPGLSISKKEQEEYEKIMNKTPARNLGESNSRLRECNEWFEAHQKKVVIGKDILVQAMNIVYGTDEEFILERIVKEAGRRVALCNILRIKSDNRIQYLFKNLAIDTILPVSDSDGKNNKESTVVYLQSWTGNEIGIKNIEKQDEYIMVDFELEASGRYSNIEYIVLYASKDRYRSGSREESKWTFETSMAPGGDTVYFVLFWRITDTAESKWKKKLFSNYQKLQVSSEMVKLALFEEILSIAEK